MAHHAVRQHRMRRHRLVEPSRFCTGAAQGSGPMPSAFRSAAGIDRLNPGERCCRGGVDPGDPRRGVRAAQHDAVQHAGQHDVVGVAPRAVQQAGVLHAANGLGEAELCRRHGAVSPGLVVV